jgi:cell cycle checkpoint control protein RAD9A
MVAFADSILATLDLQFTEPTEPLVVELDSDDTECLFAMSTSQVHPLASGSTSQQARHVSASASRKRQRDEDDETPTRSRTSPSPSGRRKPLKVVQRQDVQPAAKSPVEDSRLMPPPSLPLYSQELEYTQGVRPPSQAREEPLFLQGSQFSVADAELIRSAGLGIENMTEEEVTKMMEDDDEEFQMPPTQQEELSGFEELFDDAEMEPTQNSVDASGVGTDSLSATCRTRTNHHNTGFQTSV